MSKIFYPTAERLKYLLESIDNREVALPDFQRDFVWDPRETEELIESLCQNYPAGSLLRIKNSAGFYFKPREFQGAPPLNNHWPSYLILDGQQRLTSLYQALYGKGNHRYLVDLAALLEGKDLEDCLFYLRKADAERHYGNVDQQAAALIFPLPELLRNSDGFEVWLDSVLDQKGVVETEKKTLKEKLRGLKSKYLRNIEEYEFPMVTLSEDTSAGAVCTIFETLNRTGVKLSVFDLLVAKFWPGDLRLRDLWDDARKRYSGIADFEVDPYYVLQSIALFAAKRAPLCKRGDVLELKIDQVRTGWEPVIKGLATVLQILREDCGVIVPQWLPYSTMLVPAAATLAVADAAKGPDVAAVRNKFKRWFWCAVFKQAYEKAPNTQAVTDFTQLKRWLGGGLPPECVSQFSFDVSTLRHVTPRQRGVYRGVVALILRHGARDFHTADRITSRMIREEKIDDHHVFPQSYLQETRPDINGTLRDCVLNRTLIDKATDIRIGKRSPSDYLGEIRETVGEEHLTTILKSHLLPANAGSPLLADDFDAFLRAREELLKDQINLVTR